MLDMMGVMAKLVQWAHRESSDHKDHQEREESQEIMDKMACLASLEDRVIRDLWEYQVSSHPLAVVIQVRTVKVHSD